MVRSFEELNVHGKRVLLREDLNVPLREGQVSDESRVAAAAPTVRDLAQRGAVVVVCSHLGRPKGVDPRFSLAPVAPVLARHVGLPVRFVPAVAGPEVERAVGEAKAGEVLLLENLRFHPGEEAGDVGFAQQLARVGEIYINDAFGTAHRAHASTAVVAKFFPQKAAGPLLLRELSALQRVRDDPQRPLVVIVGGAKISGKLATLTALAEKADVVALLGGLANTFLLALGKPVGRSLTEPPMANVAREVWHKLASSGRLGILPHDVVVARSPEVEEGEVKAVEEVGEEEMILDVGPRTLEVIAQQLEKAGTVFWNGPAGVFERPAFAKGTRQLAELVAASPGFTVVGGGESVEAVHQAGVAGRICHVSTGGGASLEYLAGAALPGVVALEVEA